MAGLLMCRQGLERHPPGSDRVTKRQLAKRVNAPTVPSHPGRYTKRPPGPGAPPHRGQPAVEFAATTRAAGPGEERAPRELRHSFVSILSVNDVRIEAPAT